IDPPADAVETGHIDDRGHERDVLRSCEGTDVASGHGRNHHLGHADGETAHRGRGDRGAAASAYADDPVDLALIMEPADDHGQPPYHGPHRLPRSVPPAAPRPCAPAP